jgi:hypothetical protein
MLSQTIINPLTGRKVLYGGRRWRELVNLGAIDVNLDDEDKDSGKVIGEYDEDDLHTPELEHKIAALKLQVGPDKYVRLGSGKYKGKIVTINKPCFAEKTSKKIRFKTVKAKVEEEVDIVEEKKEESEVEDQEDDEPEEEPDAQEEEPDNNNDDEYY